MTNPQITLDLALIATGQQAPSAVADAVIASARSRQTAYPRLALTSGTGSGKVGKWAWTVATLAASGSDTIDLFAGTTLLDPFNVAVTFTTLRFLMVQQVTNPDATTDGSSIKVGGAASNAVALFDDVSDVYVVRGVSAVPLVLGDPTGITVDNTHKNLKIANPSGSNKASYLLVVGGE